MTRPQSHPIPIKRARHAAPRAGGRTSPARAIMAGIVALGLCGLGTAAAPPAHAAGASVGVEADVVTVATNKLRASVGLPALQRNSAMDTVALNWAKYLADSGQFYHNPNFASQVPQAGYRGAGENIAYNHAGGYALYDQWKNSQGHYNNMTRDWFTHIGVAVYRTDTGRYYGVQVFGGYTANPPGTYSTTSVKVTTRCPTLAGTSVITAGPTTWAPQGMSLSYQWLRGGAPISGATGQSYTVKPSDAGAQLALRVSGTLPGGVASGQCTTASVQVPAMKQTPGTPTISGTATVGRTVTANPGTWSPAGGTFTYQWLRGGAAISGATQQTYTLRLADAGAPIAVTVTSALPGYTPASATSAPVTPPLMNQTPAPVTVAGTPRVGATLTGTATGWQPTDARLTYQWLRGGAPIPGATGTTYTLQPADSGSTIQLQVTGTRTNYATATARSASTAAVSAGLQVASVSVPGSVRVGEKVTALTTGWKPAHAVLTYQWSLNGVPVVGANTASYTPASPDLAGTLAVRVTGAAPGYSSASTTRTVGQVAPGPITPGSVTITGAANAGQVLTVSPGSWRPASVTVTYQWLRGGAVIPGATGTTFKLSTADIGSTISVRVTGTARGYVTAQATSPPVGPIAAQAQRPATPVISGTAQFGATLKATVTGWSPTTATLSYQWLRAGAPISGATAPTYKVAAADVGRTLTVKVTAVASGYANTTVTSQPTAAVKAATQVPATPRIAGTAKVGVRLTATVTGWQPGGARLAYQWLRGSTAIPGATATSYVPTAADAGQKLTVRVTGTAPGYAAAVRNSAAVSIPALAPAMTVRLHRFYKPSSGTHFYTSSDYEASIVRRYPQYSYEGVIGYIASPWSPMPSGYVALHRFYRPSSGTHFYTASSYEASIVRRYPQYVYEGTIGYVSPRPAPGLTGMHRFYQPATGTHFYTSSAYEASIVRRYPQYTYEGIAYYLRSAS